MGSQRIDGDQHMKIYRLSHLTKRASLLRKMAPIDPDRPEVGGFASQLEDVVASAFNAAKEQLLSHLTSLLQGQAADIIDLSAVFDGIIEDASKVLGGMAAAGASEALQQISVDDEIVMRTARTNAESWASNRAAEMVGRKWVDGELVANPNAKWAITDTTRDGIQALTRTAVREGWSTGELANNLEDAYTFSDTRAKMVARTEVGNADSAGAMSGYKASGLVTGKLWLTAEDDAVSDECSLNADAGAIPLDESFPSGDMQPLAHPNCRCAILPVLEGEM